MGGMRRPFRIQQRPGHPCQGMLANGVLHVHVLEEGETMNNMLYVELTEDKFDEWVSGCDQLV